jgi:hypothetical protein
MRKAWSVPLISRRFEDTHVQGSPTLDSRPLMAQHHPIHVATMDTSVRPVLEVMRGRAGKTAAWCSEPSISRSVE